MKVLLVDDERPARSRLARLLGQERDVEIIGEAANGMEALEQIARLKPDLVFLDIDMPGLSGVEVAAALPENGPQVVFATAYDDYAVKAFETNAVDYLVKPIEAERLSKALARVRSRAADAREPRDLTLLLERLAPAGRLSRMAVRVGTKFVVLDTRRIAAISAAEHYVEIVIDDRKILADESLSDLEKRLDPQMFLRIHRSAIVNLDFLKEMRREGDRRYTAILADHFATELPISRESLSEMKEKLGIH